MSNSTTWVGTAWCGRDMEKTSLTTSAPAPKSSAGTRPRCLTSAPSNTSWDTTVGVTKTLAFFIFYIISSTQRALEMWQKTLIIQDIVAIFRLQAAWLIVTLLLFQTIRETPTPRATHVKPSAAVTTWDQGDHVQEAVMTLRSELIGTFTLD